MISAAVVGQAASKYPKSHNMCTLRGLEVCYHCFDQHDGVVMVVIVVVVTVYHISLLYPVR